MKALLIGGTGTISRSVSEKLLADGWELYLLNRGKRETDLKGDNLHQIHCDIHDEAKMLQLIDGIRFDVVANFIAFEKEDVERDYRLFRKRTRQYIFVSSASVYRKPQSWHPLSEGDPVANPAWDYSKKKIACEAYLMDKYREEGFPATIVRPSHTYDRGAIPLSVKGEGGAWPVVRRMLSGKPVIIHGDGTTPWTLTHARDFAKGFIGLMANPHAIGEAVHITSDEVLTWDQVYRTVAEALDVELKVVHAASEFLDAAGPYGFSGTLLGDKAHAAVFDNSKLKRLVPGYQATVRFDQGIRESISYYKAHPEIQNEDPVFDAWCDKVLAVLSQARDMMFI